MDDILERFELAVEGIARLGRYPQLERRGQWLDRLRLNEAELLAFEQTQPEPEVGYLSQPDAAVVEGGVAVNGVEGRVAAIARECRSSPGSVANQARDALLVARGTAHLNAFINLVDDAAIDTAAADAVARMRQGAPVPLLGVPVAVKDLMNVAGLPRTNGTGGPKVAPEVMDATAIARLREAGAIMIGTTNLHELAYGITSENPHYGSVANPLSAAHMSGGSSGGSAAAVAAGVVRLAIGTDTAGSIRLPASCCGVVGFKPTFDAVARDGVQTLGGSLDHVGPIAACVADAALGFAVMAGLPTRTASRNSLNGLRVGVPNNYFFDPVGIDVKRAVYAALDRMALDGAQLVPIDLPGIERSAALQFVTLCSEATDLHWQRLTRIPETLGADVRVRLEIGQFFPATWYARAQRGRAALAAMFSKAMRDIDILVTPTLRIETPVRGLSTVKIGKQDIALHAALTSLTMPFNLTGMPALTMPCGKGDNGLPIGIQIVGRRGEDWRVLNAGARLEDLLQAHS